MGPVLRRILIVVEHPGEQIDLGRDRKGPHRSMLVPLSNNGGAVPFKEAVEDAQRSFHSNFHELAIFGLWPQDISSVLLVATELGFCQTEVPRVGDDL